jgi:hypothetical protein
LLDEVLNFYKKVVDAKTGDNRSKTPFSINYGLSPLTLCLAKKQATLMTLTTLTQTNAIVMLTIAIVLPVIALLTVGTIIIKRLMTVAAIEEKKVSQRELEIEQLKNRTKLLLSTVPQLSDSYAKLKTPSPTGVEYVYQNIVYTQHVENLV